MSRIKDIDNSLERTNFAKNNDQNISENDNFVRTHKKKPDHYAKVGAQIERERIIGLVDTTYEFSNAIFEAQFKLPDGNDVLEVNHAHSAFNSYRARLLELIKGEK